ncbi:L,D-transpeptidase [Bradyrhizobium sp. STM 3562]|uniref:L,D-transpeptidase n=1 Tax=Bradyrhizobium sp. STM 3562 TaxID=578924 RepID=UPI003890F94C
MGFHRDLIADLASPRFWRAAALAATGAVGTTSHADAAVYYWREYDPGYYYRPEPALQPRRPRTPHPVKKDIAEKDAAAKPQSPLIIAVSINKQQVKIYDANGFFAQAPVSTGMRGHPTPMGVFSVIQKHKWHHSNIYSGAPMPYMQRITWSGVALHAGVLPGYPASHGCIRMPEAFAIKMWNWTRLGARVLVTPGELVPESFSHPLLPSLKVPLQSASSTGTDSSDALAAKADKGTVEGKPTEVTLELRSTVGHGVTADAAPGEKTRTADATGDTGTGEAPATMSDASLGSKGDVIELANAAPRSGGDSDQADAAANADSHTPKPETTGAARQTDPADVKAEAVKAGPKQDDANPEATNPATAAPTENGKPDAATDTTPGSDAGKDQTRPPDAAKAPAARVEIARRGGQIAVFVSRKDSKLYVRQNFAPLFDVAVTIAPSDRPLGTHVFTAAIDKTDANVLHWTVVSLPVSSRSLRRENERALTHRKGARPVADEVKPLPVPDSPAEALDRITVPADVMARIAEALTTGSSIIVSDQGINQGETGEGTDFIVSLR